MTFVVRGISYKPTHISPNWEELKFGEWYCDKCEIKLLFSYDHEWFPTLVSCNCDRAEIFPIKIKMGARQAQARQAPETTSSI